MCTLVTRKEKVGRARLARGWRGRSGDEPSGRLVKGYSQADRSRVIWPCSERKGNNKGRTD